MNNSYHNNKRIEMLDFIPENANTFLENGCGAGEFGFALKQKYSNKEY